MTKLLRVYDSTTVKVDHQHPIEDVVRPLRIEQKRLGSDAEACQLICHLPVPPADQRHLPVRMGPKKANQILRAFVLMEVFSGTPRAFASGSRVRRGRMLPAECAPANSAESSSFTLTFDNSYSSTFNAAGEPVFFAQPTSVTQGLEGESNLYVTHG